jgi:hypothetical protein
MKMNRKFKTIGLVIGCLLVWAAVASAQSEGRTIAVVLEQPKQDIPDFSLVSRLNDAFSMYIGADVIVPAEDSALPHVPDHRFDLDRLVNWGREAGVRYILYLQIDSRRIVTAKRWSIPLLLSRYVVEGHIDGAYILVDTRFGKLVNTWNLETTVEGPQQWQITEDYKDDPDLHIPAPRKITFLRDLEDHAATQIIGDIVPHLRGR